MTQPVWSASESLVSAGESLVSAGESLASAGESLASAGESLASAGESPLLGLLRAQFAETSLARCLDLNGDHVAERWWTASLSGPLLELLGRPGKAFRSRLVEVAYALGREQVQGGETMPPALPLLVEVLHAGSLIVDDIEDDSAQRRGGPALHRLVGMPLALNAGNWLYFLPHRVLESLELAPAIELELRRTIDRSVLRCHYGQALDLGVKLGALTQREVHDVVSVSTRLKTGSLLELAAEVGAIAAGAEGLLRSELARFGREYGVALQMLDDASGLYDPRRQHKGCEDLRLGRPTWPWAWLARRLDELSYSRLQHQARAVERGERAGRDLTEALCRELGATPQRAIHQQLWGALARLEHHVPNARALEPLVDEIERLERAYG